MKHASTIAKKEREDIFKLFLRDHELKFSDIEKALDLRSNNLNYHLEKMLKDDILEKNNGLYQLTKNAESMIPFFEHMTGKEKGPLTIITAAIMNDEKICLLKRAKRPYKGYWGLIGGKVKLSESIKETAIRESKEETGLDCSFEGIVSVLHERVKDHTEEENYKHAFVIFLCKLNSKETDIKQTDEGKVDWFDPRDLPKNIIPSDKYMIEELLSTSFDMKDVVIEDHDGEMKDMKIEDGGIL